MSTFDAQGNKHAAAGKPGGGQFETQARAEAVATLAPADEDGPTITRPGGTQAWYLNNRRHREDGPAFIGSDGTQEWWLNGVRHRVDGPAVTWPGGRQEWWLNGHQVDQPA